MNRSVIHALLAAALFGASTPFAKLLVGSLPPVLLAGLLYLGSGRDRLPLRNAEPDSAFRLLLIGGAPFGEEILMWWNFVGRSRSELAQAVIDWNAGDPRFGSVRGYAVERLVAPMTPWPALRV